MLDQPARTRTWNDKSFSVVRPYFEGYHVGLPWTRCKHIKLRFTPWRGPLSIPSMRAPHLNCVLTLRHISTTSSRRVATATSSVDAPAAINDIFDAPHAFRAPSIPQSLSASHVVDRTEQHTIPPLPQPILYDGPSQSIKSRSIYTSAKILPTSLPPPKVFDGPAKPRLHGLLRA
jgi:hypothetical protein